MNLKFPHTDGAWMHLDSAEFIRPPRALPLLFHTCLKTGLVQIKSLLTGNIRSQVHREAVGIIQLEYNLAREHACRQGFQRRF